MQISHRWMQLSVFPIPHCCNQNGAIVGINSMFELYQKSWLCSGTLVQVLAHDGSPPIAIKDAR
jgi:hypothetical protein